MDLNSDAFKKLLIVFKTELQEQVQEVVNYVITIEKELQNQISNSENFEAVFRIAHNIKGAARGVGVQSIGDLAHKIESLFAHLQKQELPVSSEIINSVLEALDKMPKILDAFSEKKELNFDVTDLLTRLEKISPLVPGEGAKEKKDIKKSEQHSAALTSSSTPLSPSSLSSLEDETIRVSLSAIDKISQLMEELQVNKIAFEDFQKEITATSALFQKFLLVSQKKIPDPENHLIEISKSLYYLNQHMRMQLYHLSTIANALQEEVRWLRLVPAENLLATLPRYVRDLAQSLNKKVELVIEDHNVKIDKVILEKLKDPLIHLIRNAVDHGIEPLEIRKKLAKSEMGHIKISIHEEGSQIIIKIYDDGAGIDIKKISDLAEKTQIVNKTELDNLSEDAILNLIFYSGFSTKEIITDISGRGVGLDAVKANVTNLKGQIQVKTELGKGTTFELRLPFSLSSEHGLLIKCNKQLFVIPVYSVLRTLVANQTMIKEVEGIAAILIEGHPIPLYLLSTILNLENPTLANEDQLFLVIIRQNSQAIALQVDEIIGEREIIIKPLNAPFPQIKGISGGTLLERNQIAIVLNPEDLIVKNSYEKKTKGSAPIPRLNEALEQLHILVVDDSITTRTLQKNLLEAENYKVSVAVNGEEAWNLLQRQKFSLLITDVNMPIMDGFTLTEKVKNSENLQDLPVIIVTSLGSDNEKARGVEVKADAYIVKSEFESDVLLKIIRQLV